MRKRPLFGGQKPRDKVKNRAVRPLEEVRAMNLQESGEMYLETILILSQQRAFVRSVDISEYMGYSKPSISRAVGILKNADYILVDKEGYITLTESGRAVAEKIYERHKGLTALLTRLGVSERVAADDACKMEHVISDETFAALRSLAERLPE